MTEAEVEQRLRSQTSVTEDLPDGWELARIGDLVDITSGKYIKRSNYSRISDKPYPVAGAGGPIGWTDKTNFRAPIMALGRVGAAGTLTVYQTDAWVTDNVLVIRPKLEEIFDILALFSQTIRWADIQTGSSQPLITQTLVKQLEIPVPPLSEQKRIVEKVEELLTRVNRVRERLARAQLILKRFRQAVLAAACSGRLTVDWREEKGKKESALELLKQIQKERQESLGEKRGYCHTSVKGISPTNLDLPALPDSWVWSPLNELLHYTRSASYGVLQPGTDLPSGVPMVRVCDIQNGIILIDQLKKISKEIDAQYGRTRLQGGEVLVTLVGTIGRTAVVPEEAAGANVARAVAMLPLCHHALPKFIHYILSEPSKNAELVELAREVARKTLNLGLLKAVQVPLAPLKEQQEVVRQVEAVFKLADAVEQRVEAAKVRTEKLTQAILAKAFRGELVPTEAELARREGRSYESASELLSRIKSERESRDQSRKIREN